MAKQNVGNQPESSLQCESFSWKLVPIDLERSVEGKANIRVVSPSQTPGPIPSILCSLPRSIPGVELPDASYVMMKSLLSQMNVQNQNMTSSAAEAGNHPESPCSMPKQVSSVRTSLAKNASNQPTSPSRKPGPISSKIGIKDEPKFIELVHEHPHLYDIKDPSYRDKKKKTNTWTAIGEIFGMTDDDCQAKWKSLREKYNREMKQFVADKDRVSDKTMQFLNNMSFIPYHNKTGTKRKNNSKNCNSPESVSTKRKKSNSASESGPDPTSSAILHKSKNFVETIPYSDTQTPVQEESKNLNETAAKIDQLFADTIALELQRFSPKLKNFLKAKIWQVLAEFGNPN